MIRIDIWIWCAAGILFLGLALYVVKFNNHLWSDDPAAWGQLGDYMNMYVSTSSLILLSGLTYIIHRADTNRLEEQAKQDGRRALSEEENRKALNRPVLIFKVDTIDHSFGHQWKIRNISQNVAINPVVAFSENINEWTKPVVIYSLGPGEELALNWIRAAAQLCATYDDVHGNVLTSIIQDDRMSILPGVNVLSHIPPERYTRWEDAKWHKFKCDD